MKINEVFLLDSVCNSIKLGHTFDQWLNSAPSHIASKFAKFGVTRSDIEVGFLRLMELSSEYEILLMELKDIPSGFAQKKKDGVLAAKMCGSETIKVKKFLPKPGIGNKYEMITQGGKDRRK